MVTPSCRTVGQMGREMHQGAEEEEAGHRLEKGGGRSRIRFIPTLAARSSSVVMAGKLLRGMSTAKVMPPAEADFVPVSNPKG